MSLSKDEKKLIYIELVRLAALRDENVKEYRFDIWVNSFAEDGYNHNQVMQMIAIARKMKKFGSNKLAYGDVIDAYHKETEEELPLNWTQFLKQLRVYENKAMEQIVKLVGQHITLDEYHLHKQYLENQFKKLYGINTESNKEVLKHEQG